VKCSVSLEPLSQSAATQLYRKDTEFTASSAPSTTNSVAHFSPDAISEMGQRMCWQTKPFNTVPLLATDRWRFAKSVVYTIITNAGPPNTIHHTPAPDRVPEITRKR
jgi:hypothetical protein